MLLTKSKIYELRIFEPFSKFSENPDSKVYILKKLSDRHWDFEWSIELKCIIDYILPYGYKDLIAFLQDKIEVCGQGCAGNLISRSMLYNRPELAEYFNKFLKKKKVCCKNFKDSFTGYFSLNPKIVDKYDKKYDIVKYPYAISWLRMQKNGKSIYNYFLSQKQI